MKNESYQKIVPILLASFVRKKVDFNFTQQLVSCTNVSHLQCTYQHHIEYKFCCSIILSKICSRVMSPDRDYHNWEIQFYAEQLTENERSHLEIVFELKEIH